MSLLYPQLLWLFVPLLLLGYYHRPLGMHRSIHWLILALLLLAMARPQFKRGLEEAPVNARNIIIALDVSYSMRAQDIKPDRYTFALKTIDTLLLRNTQDNIMLIAFTTNPLLLSPPTTDHAIIRTALHALNRDNILTKGTSLQKLFAKIASMPKIKRELLLITDGGEEKNLQKLTSALKNTPVHLSILAMGTQKGATVPKDDGSKLTDKHGHLVISRINPLLKTLSQTLNGAYIEPESSPEATAETIEKAFASAEDAVHAVTKKRYSYTELYPAPLLLALLLFFMLHTRASKYLILLFGLLGISAQASPLDLYYLGTAYNAYDKGDYNSSATLLEKHASPSLQRRYALASIYYKQGRYEKALKLYRSIQTRSVPIKQKLLYNIGNIYVHLKAYDKAKMYYTKALQLGPDSDTLHNLKLVVLLQQSNKTAKGRSLPKPQGKNPSAAAQISEKDPQSEKKQESSGSGSGGENSRQTKEQAKKKQQLLMDNKPQKQPLGSKVYELINKGYIRETQPW